jgi:hypothetical protein
VAQINKNFIGSRMNKSLDERLVPNGEYTDALNIRISSDEDGQAGSAENSKGNLRLTNLNFISANSVCIGAFEDGANEVIYWFVTDEITHLILSYDTKTDVTRYHIVDQANVLNFSKSHLMNGISLIDDLLFFTDNYNPPRRINVNKSYPNLTEEDLLVIVKPPKQAPSIILSKNSNDDNYIEDKFIRFSYRYKYVDGEYSALSEFSKIAFRPGQFNIDYSTFDMTGMKNIMNNVTVGFETGGRNVVGIDLCFKTSTSNIIFVIEKFDKAEEGWVDNQDVSILFNNKKIYTTLPDTELLRLYDNVPHRAKSQTVMGNRIMYGNYVDGYDIGTNIDYTLSLNSDVVGFTEIDESKNNGIPYTIDTSISVDDSNLSIDLINIPLVEDSSIFIDFNIRHSSFGGDSSYDNETAIENFYEDTFIFTLPRDYANVTDLAQSSEFIQAIQSTQDYSLTQLFYNSIQANADGDWDVDSLGVDSIPGFFRITHTSDTISIQVPAVRYELTSSPGTYAYEYFYNSSTTVSFSEISITESLHSNRDYEFGIVYMDDFSRASTALVSTNNTIRVPSNVSDLKNSVTANIINKPPSWASRYRFVMKPNKERYETVYSNLYFLDTTQSAWWVKLEGDNISKVAEGDRLLVKADSDGVVNDNIYTKILKVETQEDNFISGNPASEPSGVYAMIRPSRFSLVQTENAVVSYGYLKARWDYPHVYYPATFDDGSGNAYDIPSGSIVKIFFQDFRNGRGSSCGSRKYVFDKKFTATRDYDNLYDFIIGENVDFTVPTNDPDVDSSDDTTPSCVFYDQIYEGPFSAISFLPGIVGVAQIQYVRTSTGEGLFFRSGSKKCNGKSAEIGVGINVNRAGSTLVFETEAIDANPETYYESSESFDIINGLHQGNVQNQTTTQDAIIDLDFFNCYTFGNGVESYKINDGLKDPGFYIGERVTAVSQEDYKEAHRFADMTYSGVYNQETNINKLNEFNLGLVNYKPLEQSFGPIQKMHARQTDVLVLQEDKISYVLSSKELLSGATGGGAVLSAPEILGTQISRIEENGISHNPESFAVYGFDVFFTDAKRNAVLNLKGSGYKNDQLSVISSLGMRSWFRDLFKDNFNTFKLGSYDPYNNEYILASTDNQFITEIKDIDCGTTISQVNSSKKVQYNISLGEGTGVVSIPYSFEDGDADILITYNGFTVVSENIEGTGTITFNKDSLTVDEYSITIEPNNATYDMSLGCVEVGEALTVIRIVHNDATISGDTTHHNYNFTDGGYSSPTTNDFITFTDGPASLFTQTTGIEGTGNIPVDGSTVTMRATQMPGDLVNFSNGRFRYYMVDLLFSNLDILIPFMTEATATYDPATNTYSASFPYTTGRKYLYLMWDYKIGNPINLNYSDEDAVDVCCNIEEVYG